MEAQRILKSDGTTPNRMSDKLQTSEPGKRERKPCGCVKRHYAEGFTIEEFCAQCGAKEKAA